MFYTAMSADLIYYVSLSGCKNTDYELFAGLKVLRLMFPHGLSMDWAIIPEYSAAPHTGFPCGTCSVSGWSAVFLHCHFHCSLPLSSQAASVLKVLPCGNLSS